MTINYVLIFITLVLFVGLGVDAGILEGRYLHIQAAAKAAAVEAVLQMNENQSASWSSFAQSAAAASGYTNGVNGVTVTMNNPPSSGPYSGNSSAYQAIVSQAVPTYFLGILGAGRVTMQASAVQTVAKYFLFSSSMNINAIYTDNTYIPNGAFDNQNYAFSANALGHQFNGTSNGSRLSWRGQIFYTAAPNTTNGANNVTINLTNAKYSQILLLASTGFGPITNAQFIVTYTDSSTLTAALNMSDWCSPKHYADESIVVQGAYRNVDTSSSTAAPTGAIGNYLYGYSINVDNSKTLKSIKLPTQRNVVVFAIDLMP